jgi:hypothetical protein
MTLAWKSNFTTSQKIVLLSLCDNANDQGECYPSISMMVEKCSMSERSVFNQLDYLEKVGAISKNQRAGRSTIYKIDPCNFCTPATIAPLQPLHPTPAMVAPAPLQPLHPTPAMVAPITINEPSIEPSCNQKKKNVPLCVAVSVLVDNGFDESTANEFIDYKSRMKAPLTARAWADHLAESAKAGWRPLAAAEKVMAKSWKGFEAKYVANEAKPSAYTPPSPAITTPAREAVDPLMSLAVQESMRTLKPISEIHARLKRERIAA